MIQSLIGGTTIPVLEQVVQFTEARHNVLAGNIANMDTPGYRVRDLPPDVFQQRLREAIEYRDSDRRPVGSAAAPEPNEARLNEVSGSMETILFHDDSNVGLEQQVAALSKNMMQHETAIAIMTSQFRLLQAAISERV
jgi:flagellar basal-body rod protein FlgB